MTSVTRLQGRGVTEFWRRSQILLCLTLLFIYGELTGAQEGAVTRLSSLSTRAEPGQTEPKT